MIGDLPQSRGITPHWKSANASAEGSAAAVPLMRDSLELGLRDLDSPLSTLFGTLIGFAVGVGLVILAALLSI